MLTGHAAANDAGSPGSTVATLCVWLEHDPASPVRSHSAPGEDLDTVVNIRTVFQQDLHQLNFTAMLTLLRPPVGRYGRCDYEKMFCADLKRGEDIFELRGINRTAGYIVIERPDQYVGHILPLSNRDKLAT